MSVSFSNLTTPTNNPTNERILQDAALKAVGTLPASNTTANTGVIDLQQATPYPTTETINVYVDYTASANGNASNANGTIILMHSADNSTFTNIATLGTVPVVQAAGVAAANYTFKLPPGCYRYIKARSALSTVDNLSDSVLTLRLLF
jgi:hypothetical protein